jgi:beta-phosphoglucomutase
MTFAAAIFDVDGVLLASPHERAWREALDGIADSARFTTEFYQANVAGKPRMDGALAALRGLGVAEADQRASAYAETKQKRLEALIAARAFEAYPDALRFVRALKALGMPMAAASSSKNADQMLRLIAFDGGSLLDAFVGDVRGWDLAHGKPDPQIFLLAAGQLGAQPERCFVAEDAPVGVQAARAGGMAAIGVARFNDATALMAAGATVAVESLDDISLADLAHGALRRSEPKVVADGG